MRTNIRRIATCGAAGLGMAATVAEPAYACSCVQADEVSPSTRQQKRAELLADYPAVVRARFVAIRYPTRCTVAPIRWAYAMVGAKAQVRYTLTVTRVAYGTARRTITVDQEQIISTSGCSAPGSAACRPAFVPGMQWWALTRERDSYRRANMCSERLVLTLMGLPAPPI